VKRSLAALAAAAALALALWPDAAAAQAEPDAAWSSATEQAAEAAVARMGARRALDVRGATSNIRGAVLKVAGLSSGVGGGALGVKATVADLAAAKKDLKAQESDLEVRIELPADVLFDVDKSDIRPDAAKALAHLGIVIRSYTGPVRLIGHTDSDGSDEHNLGLSQRRAASVRQWLVSREAIDAARLATEGMGEAKPAAPNDTPANKQRNRRVEVIVRKR
jgi:outer membrane protein OmpA-like peptidoglycan-associated protein